MCFRWWMMGSDGDAGGESNSADECVAPGVAVVFKVGECGESTGFCLSAWSRAKALDVGERWMGKNSNKQLHVLPRQISRRWGQRNQQSDGFVDFLHWRLKRWRMLGENWTVPPSTHLVISGNCPKSFRNFLHDLATFFLQILKQRNQSIGFEKRCGPMEEDDCLLVLMFVQRQSQPVWKLKNKLQLNNESKGGGEGVENPLQQRMAPTQFPKFAAIEGEGVSDFWALFRNLAHVLGQIRHLGLHDIDVGFHLLNS